MGKAWHCLPHAVFSSCEGNSKVVNCEVGVQLQVSLLFQVLSCQLFLRMASVLFHRSALTLILVTINEAACSLEFGLCFHLTDCTLIAAVLSCG